MSRRAVYSMVEVTDEKVVVRDIGDHSAVLTITNDAEEVVKELYAQHGEKRFFYYDSMSELTELVHVMGMFTWFRFPEAAAP